MLKALSERLSDTALSQLFANVEWLVPAVQSIHILGIAIALTTLLMLNVRVLRSHTKTPSLADMSRSFAPWTWSALSVLLLSGALLVVAEPARELSSIPFRIKMLLVLLLALATLSLQWPMRSDAHYWSHSGHRRRTAQLLAVAGLLLCACIVAAGRLIAYARHA